MTGKENNMEVIRNSEFGGERPLFESHNLRLENVIIRAGESAIKECSNIEAVDCRLRGITLSGMYTASRSSVVISMWEDARPYGILTICR